MPAPSPTTTPARAAALTAQGREIQRARLAQSLTQPQAAVVLGVPIGTLRSWERGVRGCPPETRARIVEEWGGDRDVLAVGVDGACPCCGRAYPFATYAKPGRRKPGPA